MCQIIIIIISAKCHDCIIKRTIRTHKGWAISGVERNIFCEALPGADQPNILLAVPSKTARLEECYAHHFEFCNNILIFDMLSIHHFRAVGHDIGRRVRSLRCWKCLT